MPQLRVHVISYPALEGEGRREAAGCGDLSTAALSETRDLHPTPSHISLRSCEPTLPLQGRVSVVPAQAGTHNHRTWCCADIVEQRLLTIRRGVWVPAFAGTTSGRVRESGRRWSASHHLRHLAPTTIQLRHGNTGIVRQQIPS